MNNNRFRCLLDDIKPSSPPQPKKKRRKHINFKIQIKQKIDIDIFINFLNKDIKKRMMIDKKYYHHYNECHLKHLNFIMMEILLHRVLCLYQKNFDTDSETSSDEENIKDDILYVPEDSYEKSLNEVQIYDIKLKYNLIKDKIELDRISQEVYDKYKGFEFINLNFLKRKIYEYI